MLWIKEMELVDSVDDLMSSSSIRGIQMPNFEVLDARIASTLNRIFHDSHFKRRISLEEQKAKKEDRFFRARQIAYCLFYKTRSGCKIGEKCSYAHRQVDEQPTKRSKKNADKSAVAILNEEKVIGMKENLLPTRVTIDQGNLIREVIKSWDEDLLNLDHLIHDNWVVSFTT